MIIGCIYAEKDNCSKKTTYKHRTRYALPPPHNYGSWQWACILRVLNKCVKLVRLFGVYKDDNVNMKKEDVNGEKITVAER
jgi:hypothetical protein